MDQDHRHNEKSESGSVKGGSPGHPNIPESGELYKYLCPVDHKNNLVTMQGIRNKTSLFKPAILFVHDVGERSEMYWDCVHYICEKGLSGYFYDQRGHGPNADISGHLDHFHELVSDLLQVASWIRHMHNGAAPIIIGQGYGAIVATEFAAKYPQFTSGVVLAAPTLELAWMPGSFKRYIIRIAAEITPRLKVPKGLHPRFSNPLHRDVSQTLTTRLIQSILGPRQLRLTFAFAQELFEAMADYGRYFKSLKKPVLILKPGEDEVARFELMDKVARTHPNQSMVTTKTVTNVHHNGFTESKLSMGSILDVIINWSKALT